MLDDRCPHVRIVVKIAEDRCGERGRVPRSRDEPGIIREFAKGPDVCDDYRNAGGDCKSAHTALTGLGVRECDERCFGQKRPNLRFADVSGDECHTGMLRYQLGGRARAGHDQPDVRTFPPDRVHCFNEDINAFVLFESPEEENGWCRGGAERLAQRPCTVRNDGNSRPSHGRRELIRKRLGMHDDALRAAEPLVGDPRVEAGEGSRAKMLHRIMDGEDGSKAMGNGQQARVVVFVDVNDVWLPNAQLSSNLEHGRCGRGGANSSGKEKLAYPVVVEFLEDSAPLVHRSAELESVCPDQHRNVLTCVSKRSCLLGTVLEEEIANDQDTHQLSRDPSGVSPKNVA